MAGIKLSLNLILIPKPIDRLDTIIIPGWILMQIGSDRLGV